MPPKKKKQPVAVIKDITSDDDSSTMSIDINLLPKANTQQNLQNPWKYYCENQFELLMQQTLDLRQMIAIISESCRQREISVWDYLFIAPKLIFVNIVKKALKPQSTQLFNQILYYLQSIFSCHQLSKMVSHHKNDLNSQNYSIHLLRRSFVYILLESDNSEQYADNMYQKLLVKDQKNLYFSKIYTRVIKFNNPPQFILKNLKLFSPDITVITIEIKYILELKVNQVILYYIDQSLEQYNKALKIVLNKQENSYLTEVLITYSQSCSDHFLVKLIDKYSIWMITAQNCIQQQRYLLYILLIILNLPKQHKHLNSISHKRILPLIVQKLFKLAILHQHLIIPILLVSQQLFYVGGKNQHLTIMMIEATIVLTQNLLSKQHHYETKFLIQNSKQLLTFLIQKIKSFTHQYHLSVYKRKDISNLIKQKFSYSKKKYYDTDNQLVIQSLTYLLRQQIDIKSQNCYKLLLILKKLKNCFIKYNQFEQYHQPRKRKSRNIQVDSNNTLIAFKSILRNINSHFRKLKLILSQSKILKQKNQVFFEIQQFLSSILIYVDLKNNQSLSVQDIYSQNFIVDDFKNQKIKLDEIILQKSKVYSYVQEYVQKHPMQFIDLHIQKFFILNKTQPQQSKYQFILQKTSVFNQFITSIQKNQSKNVLSMKVTFQSLFEMMADSYMTIFLIAIYFYWLLKRKKEKQIVEIINILFEEFVQHNKFSKFEVLGCLFFLQLWQVQNHNEIFQDNLKFIINNINHELISQIFYRHNLFKQSLFYLERSSKWNYNNFISQNTLQRCYRLNKALDPSSLLLSEQNIKSKFIFTEKDNYFLDNSLFEDKQPKIIQILNKACQISNTYIQTFKNNQKVVLRCQKAIKELYLKINYYQNKIHSFEQFSEYKNLINFIWIVQQYSQVILAFKMGNINQLNQNSHRLSKQSRLNIFLNILKKYISFENNNYKTLVLQNIYQGKYFKQLFEISNPTELLKQFKQYVKNSLLNEYFLNRQLDKIHNLLEKDKQLKTHTNILKLTFYQGHFPTVMSKYHEIIKEKEKKKKITLNPQQVTLIDYYLLSIKKYTYINEHTVNILKTLSNVIFSHKSKHNYQHFISVLTSLYFNMVFTFNENLRILNIIKNWIENFDNSDSDNLFQKKIIASYYLRFYIKLCKKYEDQYYKQQDHKKQKKQEDKKEKQRYVEKKDTHKEQKEQLFLKQLKNMNFQELIDKHQQLFTDTYEVCLEQISCKYKYSNKQIQIILKRLANNYPNESIWWVLPLKKHRYCKFRSEHEQNADKLLWNQNDFIKQQIGTNIYNDIKLKIHKDLIVFLQGVYSLFQSQYKKILKDISIEKKIYKLKQFEVNQSQIQDVIKLQKAIIIPFVKPLKIIQFGNIDCFGQSKCLTMIIKVKLQDNTQKNIILKAQFKLSNIGNEQKMVKILQDVISDKLNIKYKMISLSKYFVMVEFLNGYSTLKNKRIMYSTEKDKGLISKHKHYQSPNSFQILSDSLAPVLQNVIQKNSIYQWWKCFRNYTETTATWTVLCYVFGLGDRHGQNILISNQGKVAHVDFQCCLDLGKTLTYPQFVPFRFTQNIEAPLGILKGYGIFLKYCLTQINFIQKNKIKILNKLAIFNLKGDKTIRQIMTQLQNRMSFNKTQNYIQSLIQSIQIARNRNILKNMFRGWDPAF